MGRHCKIVMNSDGLDRREAGYYSTPPFVADFIAEEMMRINPLGRHVLDPCVGKEEMLDKFYEAGKQIDSIDIDDFGVHHKSNFQQRDFLGFYKEKSDRCILNQSANLEYDYYIANPPYNCHETEYIRTNKRILRGTFREVGVSNMFSMFISAMIDLAKEGALIGLITYDSFLTARIYENLRLRILDCCTIHYLLLCPVDLFWTQKADVRTCILILQKGKSGSEGVHLLNRPNSSSEFRELLKKRTFKKQNISEIVLNGKYDRHEFIIGCPPEIKKMFDLPRLGKTFRCITGISTGNDKKYISNIPSPEFTVPFYKNPGSHRFYMEPDGYLINDFLIVDQQVNNFMVRNKTFLFKEGISCSSMGIPFGACYLPKGSTFGVNASIFCDPEDLWWLLSYLNSKLVTYIVRGLLLRTNMITSGYVSRIPIIHLTAEDKHKLSEISRCAVSKKLRKEEYPEVISRIDEVIFGRLQLENGSIRMIEDFCNNIFKFT